MSNHDFSNLVTQAPATNAPRAIHSRIFDYTAAHRSSVVSRALHTTTRVRDATTVYSRARWLDARLSFVPTVASRDVSFVIHVAVVPDHDVPTDLSTLLECATCTHFTVAGADSIPPVVHFTLNFEDALASTLVKPTPIEMHKAAVVWYIGAAEDPNTEKDPEVVMQVFLSGHLEVGGAA